MSNPCNQTQYGLGLFHDLHREEEILASNTMRKTLDVATGSLGVILSRLLRGMFSNS